MLNREYKRMLKRYEVDVKDERETKRERLDILERLIEEDKLVFIPKIDSYMYELFIDGVHKVKVKNVVITRELILVTDYDGLKSCLDYDIFFTKEEAENALEARKEFIKGYII